MRELSASQGMTICPHCQARVLSTSMSRHLANYHGIGVQKKPVVSTPSVEVSRANGGSDLERADDLDASKSKGFLAREGGRYGSYPLHDDYSDEAEP